MAYGARWVWYFRMSWNFEHQNSAIITLKNSDVVKLAGPKSILTISLIIDGLFVSNALVRQFTYENGNRSFNSVMAF